MAINFPNSPSANDVYTVNGYSWVYDGSKWNSVQSQQSIDNSISGLIKTGPADSYLTTDGTTVSWKPATDLYVLLTANRKTTSYSLVYGDLNEMIEMDLATSNTVTVPLNSSVGFPIGTQITVLQVGTGQTTISPASGVTINCTPQSVANSATLRAQWSSVQLIKRGTDSWVAIGDLV